MGYSLYIQVKTALVVSYALLSPNAEEALVVRIFGVKHIEQ